MKLNLSRLPTPLEKLCKCGEEHGIEILIKRDDMTELVSSGNKIRKLEYLLGEALHNHCDVVFTCGGIQSNHARATTHLAVKLGMKPVLFLREGGTDIFNGNLFLNSLLGADIIRVSEKEYSEIDKVFEEYKDLYEKKHHKVYVIPEGGSTSLGAMGYLDAVSEMLLQVDFNTIDGVYCAVGSGGTYAGLIAGLRYLGYSTPVFGINVTKRDTTFFVEKILSMIRGLVSYGIDVAVNREEITILNDFSGPAYAVPSSEDIEMIRYLASTEGIILDPVYTAKAFRGMLSVANKGQRVLFIHSGGMFGLFAQSDLFRG